MLTGLVGVSGGDAKAFGCSVREEMYKIRRFMGVCPQHDILFDSLTVNEHL